jgi:hypothetical protein
MMKKFFYTSDVMDHVNVKSGHNGLLNSPADELATILANLKIFIKSVNSK